LTVKNVTVPLSIRFGHASLHGVDEYRHIPARRNVPCAIAFLERDPLLAKKGRHRRVNIFIRTGDFKAAFLQRRCYRRHGRSANSKEMKFLRRFLHAPSLRLVANFASETKTRVNWNSPAQLS